MAEKILTKAADRNWNFDNYDRKVLQKIAGNSQKISKSKIFVHDLVIFG